MIKKDVRIEFFCDDVPIGEMIRIDGKITKTTIEDWDKELAVKIATALSIGDSVAIYAKGHRYHWVITETVLTDA